MTATPSRAAGPGSDAARLRLAALAGCLAGVLATSLPAPAAAAARKRGPSALPAFSSCASLLGYARRGARLTGGASGVPTRTGVVEPQILSAPAPVAMDSAGSIPAPAPRAPSAAGGEAKATPSFSSTNVQELGVDEPDVVKTDGRRVFAIVGGRLNALDVSGDAPRLVGSLELPGSGAQQLLIRGDRVLVMTTSYGGVGPAGGGVAGGKIAAPLQR
jgi:hypothetical protein